MIKLIIPSKDRAAQLRLLLRSIQQNAKDLFDINIIYTWSDQLYCDGYTRLLWELYEDKLTNKLFPQVKFYAERDFRKQVLELLPPEGLISFATDDCVFYRNIRDVLDIDKALVTLKTCPDDIACLALRLGLNVTVQTYHVGDPLPQLHYIESDVSKAIYWRHADYSQYGSWAYLCSLDAHIFNVEVLRPLIEKVAFDSPNSLEGSLANHSMELPPWCAAPQLSCVTAIPANRTQHTFKNNYGIWNYYALEDLNERYLNNEVINLRAACDTLQKNCCCTHFEIPLEFEQLG